MSNQIRDLGDVGLEIEYRFLMGYRKKIVLIFLIQYDVCLRKQEILLETCNKLCNSYWSFLQENGS